MKKNQKKTRQLDFQKLGESKKQRLQKILAAAGVDSRRKCEELILEGAVTVNGDIVDQLPSFADPLKDEIRLNGKKIQFAEKSYYLLNKPKNVVCTNVDPQGRKKAVDFIETSERIFCVGRLDMETTGAILLTNDSDLANRLTHPRYKVPKTYEIRIRGRMEGQDIEKLKKGVWLAEGKTAKASVKILKRSVRETSLQVIISQGMNRQLRRSLARLGYKVKDLRRVKIGNLSVKGLPLGRYKKVTDNQIKGLMNSTL